MDAALVSPPVNEASGPSDLAKRSRYKKDLHDGSDFD
jgi:hypothetical protein